MKEIDFVRKIRFAYERTRIKHVLVSVFFKSEMKYLFCIWGTLTSIVILFYLKEWEGMDSVNIPLSFSFVGFLMAVEFGIHNKFKRHYVKHKNNIKAYPKNKMFLRYLLFREKLPDELLGNFRTIEKTRSLISKENELLSMPLFSKHPFTIVLLGFITAIIGGGASQAVAWESGTAPIALLLIGIFLFINFQVLEIFPSRAYQQKELEQFLVWLEMEEKP